MEALFPQLFFLGPYVAPTALRIVAAVAFLMSAKQLWKTSQRGRMYAGVEGLFGVLLLVGFLTQLVAIVGVLHVIGRGFLLGGDAPKRGWIESILLIGVLLVLVVMGAGALAIDLPY